MFNVLCFISFRVWGPEGDDVGDDRDDGGDGDDVDDGYDGGDGDDGDDGDDGWRQRVSQQFSLHSASLRREMTLRRLASMKH